MTTETMTTTREERDAYLSEIRSAREAYLHPAGEGDDRSVARMRAALRLMVLLRRAPDVEASMRGRQQLIVPAWDEGRWQGDVSKIWAHVLGGSDLAPGTIVYYAKCCMEPTTWLSDLASLSSMLRNIYTALRRAGLSSPVVRSIESHLGAIVGVYDNPPAMWWLDVCALIDDATGGEVDAWQISRGVEAALAESVRIEPTDAARDAGMTRGCNVHLRGGEG